MPLISPNLPIRGREDRKVRESLTGHFMFHFFPRFQISAELFVSFSINGFGIPSDSIRLGISWAAERTPKVSPRKPAAPVSLKYSARRILIPPGALEFRRNFAERSTRGQPPLRWFVACYTVVGEYSTRFYWASLVSSWLERCFWRETANHGARKRKKETPRMIEFSTFRRI